mmetsp:Transcript_25378/g.74521  ORF Transcript_25378/g.74521 Transcript_25378/m.74521 type:complete len:238 (+) Transcript_25378:1301-2014(+)
MEDDHRVQARREDVLLEHLAVQGVALDEGVAPPVGGVVEAAHGRRRVRPRAEARLGDVRHAERVGHGAAQQDGHEFVHVLGPAAHHHAVRHGRRVPAARGAELGGQAPARCRGAFAPRTRLAHAIRDRVDGAGEDHVGQWRLRGCDEGRERPLGPRHPHAQHVGLHLHISFKDEHVVAIPQCQELDAVHRGHLAVEPLGGAHVRPRGQLVHQNLRLGTDQVLARVPAPPRRAGTWAL